MWQDFPELLSKLQFDDKPAGGSLVIIHKGKTVVNTAIGQALPHQNWHAHTLSVNFSIGKGVLATLMAVLASKGLLDYDTPIKSYWTEFGVGGKEHITPRHVLTHTSGLFNITTLTNDTDELTDWQAMTTKVAQMSPDTPKGQDEHDYGSAYAALVLGWILGGLVERVTGLSLQDALDEYLAKPLGLYEELYYKLPADKLGQVARPVRYFDGTPITKRKPTLKPDSKEMLLVYAGLDIAPLWTENVTTLSTANINRLYFDTTKMNLSNYKNALMPNGRDGIDYHHDKVMQASIPAANGVSSAHALAVIYAMHANDGVWQGQTLITPAVLADMRAVRVDGFDAVMPANMRWRSGFHRLFSLQDTPHAYGHMGYNGSVAFCDPNRHLSFAFIHNFDTTMLNDVRQFALVETAIACATS